MELRIGKNVITVIRISDGFYITFINDVMVQFTFVTKVLKRKMSVTPNSRVFRRIAVKEKGRILAQDFG